MRAQYQVVLRFPAAPGGTPEITGIYRVIKSNLVPGGRGGVCTQPGSRRNATPLTSAFSRSEQPESKLVFFFSFLYHEILFNITILIFSQILTPKEN